MTITLAPIQSPAMREAMQLASAEDGHCAPMATHVFLRGQTVVGAAGIFAPVLTFWAHTKRMHARDTVEVVRAIQKGAPPHLCACSEESPFFGIMDRFGYRHLGPAHFFEFAP